jgi:torsin-1
MTSLVLLTLTLSSLLTLGSPWSYSDIYSPFIETCDARWVPCDLDKFQALFDKQVFGQPLVKSLVVAAISGHFKVDSRKALVLSFHGWPGTGKNFVSSLLIKSIFREGSQSTFYKHYNARVDFTVESRVPIYREKLRAEIVASLKLCERAVFVFDEVDMMPAKLIDVLYPFIDYQERVSGVDPRKATFIFLSNKGGRDIADITFALWKKSRDRSSYRAFEFSESLKKTAYNEQGGLQYCDNINSHLISYYVPFLPLQVEHVIQCIEAELNLREFLGVQDTIIKEVLNQVPFTKKDSPSGGLFAVSGCKNIDTLTSTALEDGYHFKGGDKEL